MLYTNCVIKIKTIMQEYVFYFIFKNVRELTNGNIC